VRVIAGQARGHSLKAPKGQSTRPTLDRVREAIFNVLALRVPEAEVLDLFSGSGAMGIEALSRGAKSCVFNDQNKQAILVIKDNLQHTKLAERASIFNMEARQLLTLLQNTTSEGFDLVFVDPPYQSGLYEAVLTQLLAGKLLKKGSLVIVESNPELEIKVPHVLQLLKQSRYGDTLVSYYENMEE